MSDAHWSPAALAPRPARPPASERTSRYLPMRDGVPLAVDIHLPASRSPGARLPTIVRQTRYFRAVHIRPPFHKLALAQVPDLYVQTRARFLAAGYAWVDVDVRGSGASGGARPFPWAPDEVRDGATVVDWIVQQGWSDGSVGTLGVSYDGTCAELLLVNQHPAVRASAPLFSLYDVYTDVAFPGGAHLAWFTEAWNRFNRTLDDNAFARAAAQAVYLMLRGTHPGLGATGARRAYAALLDRVPQALLERALAGALGRAFGGVRRVEDDPDGAQLRAAVAAHFENFDVHQGALAITYRDDRGVNAAHPEQTIDAFSPHHFASEIAGAGAAVYSVSGWRDGAYPHAAVKRFVNDTDPRAKLLLGPWCHGGKLRATPGTTATRSAFDLDGELLRFFDAHLRPTAAPTLDDPRVHYFVTGTDTWRASDAWPPRESRAVPAYLTEHRALRFTPPAGALPGAHAAELHAENATGSGDRSRWRCLLGSDLPGDYPDRAARDRALVVFTSGPLGAPLEIAGHPVLTLTVRADGPDAVLVAYLEELFPDGTVGYVTEGELRALHRAVDPRPTYRSPAPQHSFRRADGALLPAGSPATLVLDLLPVAHCFRRGSAVRLALSLGDADHFRAPSPAARTLAVLRDGSQLALPVVGPAPRD